MLFFIKCSLIHMVFFLKIFIKSSGNIKNLEFSNSNSFKCVIQMLKNRITSKKVKTKQSNKWNNQNSKSKRQDYNMK